MEWKYEYTGIYSCSFWFQNGSWIKENDNLKMLTFLCMLFHHISNMNLNYDIFLRMKNFDHFLFSFFSKINWLPYAYYYRKKHWNVFSILYILYKLNEKKTVRKNGYFSVFVCVCIKKNYSISVFLYLLFRFLFYFFFIKKPTPTQT